MEEEKMKKTIDLFEEFLEDLNQDTAEKMKELEEEN